MSGTLASDARAKKLRSERCSFNPLGRLIFILPGNTQDAAVAAIRVVARKT